MRTLIILSVFLSEFMVNHGPARAVTIDIDIPTQRMQVTSAMGDTYVWPVSTARKGFVTPPGSFTPYNLQKMHRSDRYGLAPMPYAIFFHEGYAIHGGGSAKRPSRPASPETIRLSSANAAKLYALVRAEGALISIHDAEGALAAAKLRADEPFDQWALRLD